MLYQLSYTPANQVRSQLPLERKTAADSAIRLRRSTSLFVIRVLDAPGAELLELHPVRMETLVLLRRVVPHLATAAGEGNYVPHET